MNYYNEIDDFAAAWLEQLIAAGHIAPGVVDRRSIEDVSPNDLKDFTQCHFFAGIGVWSYALRRAGVSDDTPVWTGSCPCQPFSSAGKGTGFDDERHLWPHFHYLIEQCQPAIVFGEQVASKDGLAWLDLVSADLEATGYAFGAADLCAAGFGAPHIRQRSFWVADAPACGVGTEWKQRSGQYGLQPQDRSPVWAGHSGARPEFDGLADTDADRRDEGVQSLPGRSTEWAGGSGVSNGLGHSDVTGLQMHGGLGELHIRESKRAHQARQRADTGLDGDTLPTNGFWREADWLGCRDGKWRPVEPGTFPLVNGAANRVGRLRGYGNAIVAPVAQAFIESVM